MASRRLLVIGNVYPPHVLGGYELLCRDHVAWMRRRDVDVTVLTSTYGTPRRRGGVEPGDHGERVVRALDFHWKDFEIRRPRGVALWRGELRQRRVLERLLTEHRPEAVQLWHMAGLSKSLLGVLHRRGLPTVAVVGEPWPVWDVETDAWFQLWRAALRRRPHRIIGRVRHAADRLVAPTDAGGALATMTAAYCSTHLMNAVEGEVAALRGRGVVVPNGIDVTRVGRARDSGAPLHAPLRLLCLGRVERRKGVHTAVEALAVLRDRGVDARLDVVGWSDERYAAELRSLATGLGVGDRLALLGPVPRESVPDVYLDHDMLLFPTLWEEPFGLVPLEAMAAGCIVVGSGTGGSGEFMREGETALIAPPGDPVRLAERVLEVTADADLRDRLRRAGYARAQTHTLDGYCERLERLTLPSP